MNLLEALKSGRPFRRKGYGTWWLNDDSGKIFGMSKEDMLGDYEVQEPGVTITRTQFFEAAAAAIKEHAVGSGYEPSFDHGVLSLESLARLSLGRLAKKLGLEE